MHTEKYIYLYNLRERERGTDRKSSIGGHGRSGLLEKRDQDVNYGKMEGAICYKISHKLSMIFREASKQCKAVRFVS